MAKISQHNAKFKCAVIIAALLCVFSAQVFAQNTKGDKPAKIERSVFKLPKIKTKSKRGDKAYRGDITGRRRIRTRDKSSATHITQNPTSNYNTRQPSKGDRAYQTPPGMSKRIRSSSASIARNNIYPKNWPYANIPKYKKNSGGDRSVFSANETMRFRQKRAAQAARRIARSSGGALTRSTSPYDFRKKHSERASQSGGFWPSVNGGRFRNPNKYTSNPSPFPRHGQRAASGRSANRSASRSYVTWGRKNVYWGKFKVKEKPITTDISGRRLRSADFHSLPLPSGEAKARRNAIKGDRPGFLGQLFLLVPHAKDRSWHGNISGNALRRGAPRDPQNVGSSFSSGALSISKRFRGVGGTQYRRLSVPENPSVGSSFWSGASRSRHSPIYGFRGTSSASGGWNNSGRAISGRTPSGGWSMGNYQGNIKTRRPLKGGGSIRQQWNNNQQPLTGKSPSSGWIVGTYQGNIKTRRPLKGGGSIRQQWNNNQQPLTGKSPSSGWIVGTYQGNIKTRRPLKGGGSIRQQWNNNQQPLTGKSPSSGWIVGTYQGNIRTRRPYKGGGSVRQQWNNGEQPILGTAPLSGFRMGIYQGNLKTRRPLKGGGSIKQLWNNNEQPITINNFGDAGYSYTGKMRTWGQGPKGGGSIKQLWNNGEQPLNGKYFNRAGYVYTGNIRTWGQGPKGGGSVKQLWNNGEQPLNGKYFNRAGYVYTGNIRTWGPDPKGGGSIKQSWNNKEKPLNGKYFAPVSISTIEYSGKMQAFWRAKIMKENLAGRVPMKKYVHSPHGVKEALMVLSPSSVTMHINDYQVSVKMFKPQGKNLHPDAQFAHSLRDNVKEERTLMMNLKLTWAKFFKKNDNQTKAVKDKVHKPRYDPKERDLWKDLYD